MMRPRGASSRREPTNGVGGLVAGGSHCWCPQCSAWSSPKCSSTSRPSIPGRRGDFSRLRVGPASTPGSISRSPPTGWCMTHCVGPAYPPHSTCGTVGFAPLYPLLIAFLGHLGLSLPVAAMVITVLFAYLTLQAMWMLIGPAWSFSSLCCLAFAACFPGMVYYYALFPVSLLAFFAILCLLLFIRRHYLCRGSSAPSVVGPLPSVRSSASSCSWRPCSSIGGPASGGSR